MDAKDELLGRIRPLLITAIGRVNDFDGISHDAFEQATRTLEGTSTGYQRTVKILARRAEQSVGEVQRDLTAAIRLVDDLIRCETTPE